MSRILAIALPHLATDRLRRRWARDDPARQAPFATIAAVKGAQRIVAVDTLATQAAVRPGMSLADARAVCPRLAVADADPQGETATLRRLVDWCRRFTPLAGLDPPDGLLLDVSGATHLFGGEAATVSTIEQNLAHHGFMATGAVADTPEAAWALARFGETRIAPPGFNAIRRLAEPLPLAALRLDPKTLNGLAQAGLRHLSDLMMRPRAPLAARFGQPLMSRLDGLLGLSRSPIDPCFPVPVFVAERRYLLGLTQIEAVERTLAALSDRLAEQLERAGQGARRLEAAFFRVDGVVKSITVGTSRPAREPAGLTRLFREKLASLGEEGLDTGYGFDLIRLGALAVEPLAGRQPDLIPRGSNGREADLDLLIDRLGARLGFTRVVRLMAVDRHWPEEAAVAVPAARGRPVSDIEDDPDLVRPFRLFERPEPISTVAGVPDGPPAAFTWRRARHEIAAVEGPERIAASWWHGEAPVRDYYEAEDRQGRRFWLFREGLYGASDAQPRWYVHGLFG